MKRILRSAKHSLFHVGVRLLQISATVLPRLIALRLFAALGRLVRHVDRPAVSRSRAHLRIALGRETSEAERDRIVRRMFPAIGRNLVDLLRLGRFDERRVRDLVDLEGLEHLDAALAGGRGAIALSAHLGNWEILAGAIATLGYPMHVVAREIFEKRSHRLLNEWRRGAGVVVHPRSAGLWPAVRALRSGAILGTVVDQDTRGPAVFVDFFGKPARTPSAPFAVARRTGAPLVPMWIFLDATGRHRARILPPYHVERTDDEARDVTEAVRYWHGLLEGAIRETPEQWVWYHRRWKTAPPAGVTDLREFSRKSAYLTPYQGSRRAASSR